MAILRISYEMFSVFFGGKSTDSKMLRVKMEIIITKEATMPTSIPTSGRNIFTPMKVNSTERPMRR